MVASSKADLSQSSNLLYHFLRISSPPQIILLLWLVSAYDADFTFIAHARNVLFYLELIHHSALFS